MSLTRPEPQPPRLEDHTSMSSTEGRVRALCFSRRQRRGGGSGRKGGVLPLPRYVHMPCGAETAAGSACRLPPGTSAETPRSELPLWGPSRLLHASGSENGHTQRRTPSVACAQGSCFYCPVVPLEFPHGFEDHQDLPMEPADSGLSPPLCGFRTVTP